MKEFLDSYAFEQMAKEYNQKYSKKVVTLSKDSFDFEKYKALLDKIFKLLYLFERGFKKNPRFFEVLKKSESIRNDLQSFFEKHFEQTYKFVSDKKIFFVNHKLIANIFLDALQIFEDVLKETVCEQVKAEVGSLKKDFINLIQNFYKLI